MKITCDEAFWFLCIIEELTWRGVQVYPGKYRLGRRSSPHFYLLLAGQWICFFLSGFGVDSAQGKGHLCLADISYCRFS